MERMKRSKKTTSPVQTPQPAKTTETPSHDTFSNALSHDPNSLSEEAVMQLQRTIGNHAVMQMLREQGVLQRSTHDKGCGCGSCREMVQREAASDAHGKGCGCVGCRRDVQRKQTEVTIQRWPWSKKKKTEPEPSAPTNTDRGRFERDNFHLADYTPSTNTGIFDAHLNPITGEFVITSKVHFNFKDVDLAYASSAKNKKELTWKKSDKKAWVKRWIASVMEKWGSIPTITTTKQGFEDFVVKPRINIQTVDSPDSAHFALDVTKAFEKKEGGMRAGGMSGVRTATEGDKNEGTGAFQEQDAYDKINDGKMSQHFKDLEDRTNILPAYERDRKRLVDLLSAAASIPFTNNSGDFANGGQDAVKAAAAKILRTRKMSALADLHPIEIQFSSNASKGKIAERLVKIRKVLRDEGVENNISAKIRGDWSADTVKIAAGPDLQSTKDQYLNNWDRYTSAHEFGHMIGLLDEYCPAVSPELLVKMVDEGQLAEDPELSKFAKGKERTNAPKQKAYAELLEKNDMEVQNWASPEATKEEKSTSLMSGGFEMLPQHYVTIWEALTEVTKNHLVEQDWKLSR